MTSSSPLPAPPEQSWPLPPEHQAAVVPRPSPLPEAKDARHPYNVGHGRVFVRPDGKRAQCGGPPICRECAQDAAILEARDGAHADAVRSAVEHLQALRTILADPSPVKRSDLQAHVRSALDDLEPS